MPITLQSSVRAAIDAGRIGKPVAVRVVAHDVAAAGQVEMRLAEQLANAAHMADRTGLYCDPHTGVALGALLQMVEDKSVTRRDRIVVISTAHGLKFSEFKTRYHKREMADIHPEYANPISECAADVGQVRAILEKRFKEMA